MGHGAADLSATKFTRLLGRAGGVEEVGVKGSTLLATPKGADDRKKGMMVSP